MKLLIFSDSHNETEAMLDAVRRENPELIVHLGDHIHDTPAIRARFPDIPLRTVRGNCDFGADGGDMELLKICGRMILLTHGHLYGVKNGLDKITRKGASAGADLVLFGHTHRAYIGQSGRLRLFNPGAVCGRGWDRDRTYGVAYLGEEEIRCEIKEA